MERRNDKGETILVYDWCLMSDPTTEITSNATSLNWLFGGFLATWNETNRASWSRALRDFHNHRGRVSITGVAHSEAWPAASRSQHLVFVSVKQLSVFSQRSSKPLQTPPRHQSLAECFHTQSTAVDEQSKVSGPKGNENTHHRRNNSIIVGWLYRACRESIQHDICCLRVIFCLFCKGTLNTINQNKDIGLWV